MALMQLRSNQIQGVKKEIIEKYESRFIKYFRVCIVVGLFVFGTMYCLDWLWDGKRIWGTGTFLTTMSVIYLRFFEVKKNAAPENQRICIADRSKQVLFLERAFNHAWLLGGMFLIISKWFEL